MTILDEQPIVTCVHESHGCQRCRLARLLGFDGVNPSAALDDTMRCARGDHRPSHFLITVSVTESVPSGAIEEERQMLICDVCGVPFMPAEERGR